MRILTADDKRKIRESLVDILFDAGYDLIEAEDGGEAFEKASHENPDVILLDVMMPMLNGFQLLERIRANPATESIPVILLTPLSADQGERTGSGLGVDHYITKPFDDDMVKAARTMPSQVRSHLSSVYVAGEEPSSWWPTLMPLTSRCSIAFALCVMRTSAYVWRNQEQSC